MTVWIVNPFDNLPAEGCRPQRYWLMARAFASAGWRVRLFSSDFSHATKRKRVLAAELADAIAVELAPTPAYSANVCLRRIWSHRMLAKRTARRMDALVAGGERPDVIVASTPPLGLCRVAMDAARRYGARFVCDIQDAWPETFGRLLPRGFGWLGAVLFAGMRGTARRIYRDADMVSGVSGRYAALSGRSDFKLSHHGIAGDAVSRISSAGPHALVYAGNLGNGYDLETVLELLAVRDELTLDVAGLGPRLAGLRELSAGLGLGGRVRFHGYLDDVRLRELFARCDVGVIPMRDDSWVGLPYKLGDYLAAGLPVVSSLHGECGELLARTGFGRCYEGGSARSLSAAIDDLARVEVTLPRELRADVIYPRYVAEVADLCKLAEGGGFEPPVD